MKSQDANGEESIRLPKDGSDHKNPHCNRRKRYDRYELDQRSRSLGRQECITSTQASGGHSLPSAVRPQKVADTIARYGRQNKNDFPVLDQKGGSSYPRG